jgi:hypothetical protein
MENLNGKHHLGNINVAERIILKGSLKEYGVRMWVVFIRLRMF